MNLIVVPGHAVYIGEEMAHAHLAHKWVGTFPGYRYGDEVPLYVDHIRQGVILARHDPDSVLIFSGGETRRQAEHVSEAASHMRLAEQWDWFGVADYVSHRAYLETYARDSFENVLCSIDRFHEVTGKYPTAVTVVGFAFKQKRFELHAHTIIESQDRYGIPKFEFQYCGVNNPPQYLLNGGSAEGEAVTLAQFVENPHGDKGSLLEKRLNRSTIEPAYRTRVGE